jgi:Carboxypeptidase regulatory-like domain
MRAIITGYVLCVLLSRLCLAQALAGIIAGVVRDPSGAVIVGVQVQAVSRASGQARRTLTAERGDYSFPALLAGEYDVGVEAPGFQQIVRAATVEVGSTTTANFDLRVGNGKDTITADAASPQMHYDAAGVAGVILRSQIEDLPLNGRGFLELAKLEPGGQAPSSGNRNRTLVPILGAPGSNVSGLRVTVDGGNITSVGLGGSQMGLSQDVVQEFQVASVNFDLSTGLADAGAINLVTRAGGNGLHGTAFYFFRDHNLAAYPALSRDLADPNPFFQRRQFGFTLGGPIRRNRIFYFGNWERNEQRGVGSTTLLTPDFAHFSRTTPSPLFGDLLSVRLDGRINGANTVFVRYSHDGSRAFGPAASPSGGSPNDYPSHWNRVSAWADQSLLGLTSILRPTLINDFRFSYFFISSSVTGPEQQDCPGCLGIGAPAISIAQAGLVIGNSTAVSNLERRFQLNDSITWQRNAHRVRFGADWEHTRDGNLVWGDDPATIQLFAPSQVKPTLGIPLPGSFQTLDDILQLPLQSVTVGIGDPRVPQENGGQVRRWNTLWLYFQDTWRLHPRLTLNYGLGWSMDGILNHDLSKPALLAPILGANGLGPTRRNWANFSPQMGLSWAPSSDRKTVVRAGAGLYYAPLGLTSYMDAERVALGAYGLGRQTFQGSSITNSLVPCVPSGGLNFNGNPTQFTGADLTACLPSIEAALAHSLRNSNPGVQAIQITKQAAAAIFPAHVPSPSALHANLGLQREIVRDFVLSADLVYRHFVHVPQNGGALDANRYNSTSPVITRCVGAQGNDPQALCSSGPIMVYEAPYRSTYKGLLLRAEKRLSHGFQLLGSYAYSSNTGTNAGNGFNLYNWLQNSGPLGTPINILNLAGVVDLPGRFELGLNFSYTSAPPFSAYLGGIDFNGDGTAGDLLPGTTMNAFGRSLGRADLVRLVDQFNQTYAGTKDAQSRSIPHVVLPGQYSFGDNSQSLDLRLSRSFGFHERWRLWLIGEVFNLYNKVNLIGYSGDLTSTAFGQPTNRANQVFGSGGPRAFQLAMRVSF